MQARHGQRTLGKFGLLVHQRQDVEGLLGNEVEHGLVVLEADLCPVDGLLVVPDDEEEEEVVPPK